MYILCGASLFPRGVNLMVVFFVLFCLPMCVRERFILSKKKRFFLSVPSQRLSHYEEYTLPTAVLFIHASPTLRNGQRTRTGDNSLRRAALS